MLRHPEPNIKMQKPIACFIFGKNIGGYAHIDIKYTDGTQTDISWTACLAGKAKDPKNDLTQALREAIGWQIFEYKKSAEMICEICLGEIIDDKIHVDHEIPFKKLTTEFLKANEAPKEFADCLITHKTKFRPEDEIFQKAWEEFHQKNAILRISHPTCNLKRSRF